ncbi:phage tail protein [Heyndrickxia coagulans]|uniref:phage tail protein n=1 Tax=Heyndrickxia coagulans TaxID=1398 RepID=UPI002E1EEA9A|nr:phage tail protein [Heyndrickxia coagulans]
MPFKKSLPEWNKEGTEPPQSLKDSGWQANQKPPADYFNWFFNKVFLALSELQKEAVNEEQIGVPNGIATLDQNGDLPLTQADNIKNWVNQLLVTASQNGLMRKEDKSKLDDITLGTAAGNALKLDSSGKVPAGNLPGATTSAQGAVQLNDSYTSTSTTQAPTANALKMLYDYITANAQLKKITADNGDVSISVADTTQDFLAAVVSKGVGLNTVFCEGGAVNAPSTKPAWGISYFSTPKFGFIYMIDTSNTQWSNFMKNGNWVGWSANNTATWYNLPLNNGAVPYNPAAVPQYSKIGGFIVIRGALKGITKTGNVYATLPDGYRPITYSWSYIQNATNTGGFANSARWAINTDGSIVLEFVTQGAANMDAGFWFPMHTVFPVF